MQDAEQIKETIESIVDTNDAYVKLAISTANLQKKEKANAQQSLLLNRYSLPNNEAQILETAKLTVEKCNESYQHKLLKAASKLGDLLNSSLTLLSNGFLDREKIVYGLSERLSTLEVKLQDRNNTIQVQTYAESQMQQLDERMNAKYAKVESLMHTHMQQYIETINRKIDQIQFNSNYTKDLIRSQHEIDSLNSQILVLKQENAEFKDRMMDSMQETARLRAEVVELSKQLKITSELCNSLLVKSQVPESNFDSDKVNEIEIESESDSDYDLF